MQNQYGLFYFSVSDIVNFNNIYVLYNYDFYTNCKKDSYYYGWILGALCANPISLIKNDGTVNIYNMSFQINITLNQFYEYKLSVYPNNEYMYMLYNQWEKNNQTEFNILKYCDNTLICNLNKMNIDGLYIDGVAAASKFIYSPQILNVRNMKIDGSKFMVESTFIPNILQSEYLIFISDSEQSITNVSDSVFTGGYQQIASSGGFISINNSIFQYATQGLFTVDTKEVIVENCIFRRLGRYYGTYYYAPLYREISFQPLLIQTHIYLNNNTISAFDPSGLIWMQLGPQTLINNKFIVDFEDIYYYVSPHNLTFASVGLMVISSSPMSSVINNDFILNGMITTKPWIYYGGAYGGGYNTGTNCLSGNKFNGFAFSLHNTNITSCTRPKLLNCLINFENCSNNSYGIIQQSNYQTSIFNNTDNGKVFEINTNFMALDNIIIQTDENYVTVTNGSNMFLLDSILMSNTNSTDIYYNDATCNLIYNERMDLDVHNVSKIAIKCNISSATQHIIPSMNWSETKRTYHLTPIQLDFRTSNSAYWPGGVLQFNYSIMDMFENIIYDSKFDFGNSPLNVIVDIPNLSVSATISIFPNGQCPMCDNGIPLLQANLKDSIGQIYEINIALEHQYLLLTNTKLPLYIVGCPNGFGATPNGYQCELCPSGTYNFQNNNTQECYSCQQNQNHGVECIYGKVDVLYNQWLKVNDDHSLSSSFCPFHNCCNERNGCRYIKGSQLCANNRDPTSTLCSQCMAGYSQVFTSTICKKCTKEGIYATPLIITILFGIFVALYLLYSQTEIVRVNPPTAWKRETTIGSLKRKFTTINRSYLMIMVKLLLFNGIVYYEQSLSQIIIRSNVSTAQLSWWVSLFNVSLLHNYSSSADDNSGLCFFDGMTSKASILFGFVILGVICLTLFSIKFLNTILKEIHLFGYNLIINHGDTFICFLLLSVGKTSSILFSLLSCQTINNIKTGKTVHFYFGYEDCYGSTWYGAFLGLMAVILIFCVLCFILCRMPLSKRQNAKENSLYSLTKHYKPTRFYWEFVVFSRRIIVAFLAIAFDSNYSRFSLFIILLIYLYLQHKCEPFIIKAMNDMEIILIALLAASLFVASMDWDIDQFAVVLISIFAIIPFLFLLYYASDHIYKNDKDKTADEIDVMKSNYHQHSLQLGKSLLDDTL
eukprot:318868_1